MDSDSSSPGSLPTSPTSVKPEPVNNDEISRVFPGIWQCSTTDSNLSLHGFKRFKTSHLVNLRFLEEELAVLDHKVYQNGLRLSLEPAPADRLALKHSRIDTTVPSPEDTMTRKLILQLRNTVKEYDSALASFSQIMAMETVALLDDGHRSSLKPGISAHELYNTRLVRVDLPPRSRQDPFQRWIHKLLRWIRFRRLLSLEKSDVESGSSSYSPLKTHQNTVEIAEIIGRILFPLIAAIFLIVPLVVLSYEENKKAQLTIISAFLVTFALTISVGVKTTNMETLAGSAAYAAVLSVFVSNGSCQIVG